MPSLPVFSRWLVPGLALLLPCVAQAQSQGNFTALQKLQSEGAQVTAVIYDLDTNKPLQTLNPDKRLSPASVTKLVVAAAALDTWAADKTFDSRLLATGVQEKDTLKGDLILQSAGDATFDHRTLWMLATQLRAAGITNVTGKLLVNPSYGPLGCDNADRCEALERSDTAFNVPLAAIGVDYGTWCADVYATMAGQDAQVRGCGTSKLPLAIVGSIKTLPAKAKPTFWIERFTEHGQDQLRVGGGIAQGDSQRVFRAMSNPAMGVGLILRESFIELGIRFPGPVEVTHAPPPEKTQLMAQVDGLALREQLGRMLRYSNNYIADLLTLNLGAVHGKPPTQLAEAAKSLSNYIARHSAGAKTTPPKLYSGSGLTPENELSANDLVGMLADQYRDTRNFPAFYGALVVPRQAPFAFLRQGNADWLDRVTLKTGTMNDPRSVCGIAGYLRKKNGGWMAFAIIVNGGDKMKHVPLYKSMEAARGDIQTVLAKN